MIDTLIALFVSAGFLLALYLCVKMRKDVRQYIKDLFWSRPQTRIEQKITALRVMTGTTKALYDIKATEEQIDQLRLLACMGMPNK
jgi:hypothetical protein